MELGKAVPAARLCKTLSGSRSGVWEYGLRRPDKVRSSARLEHQLLHLLHGTVGCMRTEGVLSDRRGSGQSLSSIQVSLLGMCLCVCVSDCLSYMCVGIP